MRPPLAPPERLEIQHGDGYRAKARFWRSSKSRRAALYLHGIQSHGGWYEWSASVLADCGHSVLMPDRRGSGLNMAERGDVRSGKRWVADVGEWADILAGECGPRAVDVVGVSWGGKLACEWARHADDRCGRLLLICPGIFPAVGVTRGEQVSIGLSALLAPRRSYEIPLGDPALFTRSPEGRAFIAADQLKLTHATARMLVASTAMSASVGRMKRASLHPKTTLFLAENDRIIRNAPTRAWLERVAATPPNVRVFPDADHTLEFEPDPTHFERALQEWAEGN
ncbi:MAG: alpha/beta fold hydrolase [Phycisphaerae bacterium]